MLICCPHFILLFLLILLLTEFYDIDNGVKTSLAKRVAQSPIRYSIMKSSTHRFGTEYAPAAPSVDYNTDTMHKSGFARSVADSKVSALIASTKMRSQDENVAL